MANASYTAFKTGILTGAYDLDTAVLKVALVTGYTYNAAHATFADVTSNGGVLNGTPATLANPTVVAGVFDADDCTITTTASAANHVLIVYQASAVTGGADVTAANQKLCFFFDTGTNIPVTPGAGTLTITWPSTAGKIYKVGA
jgi:hypothetical protein